MSTVIDFRETAASNLLIDRRIDAILRRCSRGRFRSLRQLVTTPGYTPTLRHPVLADAYDAAQAARGDARRAAR